MSKKRKDVSPTEDNEKKLQFGVLEFEEVLEGMLEIAPKPNEELAKKEPPKLEKEKGNKD